jgi:CRP-like cAMP-binding protein
MLRWSTDEQSRRAVQRLIFRCVADFLTDQAGIINRANDGDFVRALVRLTLDLTTEPVGETTRGPTVRALARSLSLPFETVRRKVARLEEDGLVRRTDDGVIALVPSPPEAAVLCEELRRLINRLEALGIERAQFAPPPAQPRQPPIGEEAAGLLIRRFILRALEIGAVSYSAVTDALLFTSLIGLNASNITDDPELAQRFAGADTPPPDHLRRPVRPLELADRLGLAYEPVRRRLQGFVEEGLAVKVGGGYLGAISHMQRPEVQGAALSANQRFAQLLQGLVQAGFDFEPASP